jgi:hypothetical protein
MASPPVTLDLSKSQPIGGGVTLDLSQSQPLNAPQQTLEESGFFNTLGQGAIGAGKSALRTIYNSGSVQGPQYLGGSGLNVNTASAPEAIQPTNTAQKVGGYAETAAELAAPFIGGGQAAMEALPNAKRAGQAIGAVEDAIGHLPVDTSDVMTAAQRAMQLGTRGAKPPQVITDFFKRMSPTFEGDVATSIPSHMTFEEARDFYSNARNITREELSNLKGKQIDAMVNFANSLGDSLTKTAQQGGQGAQYAAALKEYRQAKTLGDVIDAAKKWGIPASLGLLGAKGAYDLVKGLVP